MANDLNIIEDGPFYYIVNAATGERMLTLASSPERRGFYDFDDEKSYCYRTLTEWTAIARRRL
jgi:hypothetical protein